MADIHGESFPPGSNWTEAAFATLLALPGVFGLLAETGGLVLARVTLDEAEILTLAVVPLARRLGVGRGLLAAAQTRAAAAGAVSMFLEVAEDNAAARALYAAAGYRPVGRRRAYYAGGGDALVLRRELQAASRAPPAA